ncbi:MAG: hypothetical protein KZQ81_01845 [Candidatus Thiodiazotropha sp. (ex Rostrolucina anterorostrata)]|nr:hypothetical protein [Candidatus Thiodiazotropha sp. (ex Rostrolucina anterorostrata)]
MNQREKQIREVVDRLLFEQGVYIPLELLLVEGRLLYADYEAWREGRCDYLEDLLFGDPEQSYEMMQQAETYARALGLAPEPQRYLSWGAGQREGLRFSPVSGPDSCFQTGYRKGEDAPQMDLLMESPGVTLANGIIQALLQRDEADAGRLLERLFEVDPGYYQLGGFEHLVASARRESPIGDIALELQYMQQELSPLAEEILGASARHFLAPQWRGLSQALIQVDFDPRKPELHGSYTSLQTEDWRQVKASIEAEPCWQEQPLLLRRHARACGRLHLDLQALSSWFRLCWRFPEQASSIASEAEPEWQRDWQRFLELDLELPDSDFPAWLLIDHPGLARRLTIEQYFDDFDPPDDFRVVAELVQAAADTTVDADSMALRKRLQQCNTRLFAYYLRP